MKRILVKSGVEQLPLFKGDHYHFYEAHLKSIEDLPALLKTNMKLVAVHLPSSVRVGPEIFPLDFCREDAVGDAAYNTLQEVMRFCDSNDVKYIVIHLGFFNSLRQNRLEVLERTARRFMELPKAKTALCFENVPHWITLSQKNEPIISLPKHWAYFQHFYSAAKAVLDTDHLAITTVFNCFYEKFQKENSLGEQNDSIRKKWEEYIAAATSKDSSFYILKINAALKEYLFQTTPTLIHAVGSDFCNYKFIEKLPVVGEALPLGYKGKIKGFLVEDRIDHAVWLSRLPADVDITLELHLRPEYDYLQEIDKNHRFLSENMNIIDSALVH